ncbi:MAG: Epoxyqueuosine reductase [Methanocella sp. PtaU1.Bin125]|nr:MAG: Epoxyqueuosine reductase [Methanocella sp. PtaU1.Bin125]
MIKSEDVKKKAKKLGADLCGIAYVDRFGSAPEGFRPTDVYPACRSVIVVARRLPPAIFEARSRSPYSMVSETERVQALDTVAVELCNWLYDHGVNALPVPSDAPYDFWDPVRKQGRGIISLKHAAELAGLGRIGKNTLLVNKKYGNMINLGAVLADADLRPDRPVKETYCIAGCRKCLDACPSGALDGVTADQKRCREYTYRPNRRGQEIVWCSECRRVCPRSSGV